MQTSESSSVPSICGMCDRDCPISVRVHDGRVTGVSGAICPRGHATVDFVYHPDRLRHPLVRTGPRGSGEFAPVSWDRALDDIASRLLAAKGEYGAQSVVFYSGFVKEHRAWLQRLAHSFGSPNYMSESSVCYTATVIASQLNFGWPRFGVDRGLSPETGLLVLWAANPEKSYVPLSGDIYKAQDRGMKLAVVDARATRTAERADLFVQPKPGTDGALALAVLKVLIETERFDREFVERHVYGFGALRGYLGSLQLEDLSDACGVPLERVQDFADLVTSTTPLRLQTSVATLVHQRGGVQTQRAVTLIPALTGSMNVPGGTWLQSGTIPGTDVSLANRLGKLPPRVGDDRFRVWSELIPEAQAMDLPRQILSGEPYPIRAFVGIGANVMMWPDSHRMARALKELDLVVTTDLFHTPTTALADYVLPAASFLEREALFIDGEKAFLKLPVIEPLGESWPDWRILFELAKRLGLGEEFWNGSLPGGIGAMLAGSGVSYDELQKARSAVHLPHPEQQSGLEFDTPTGKLEAWSTVLEQHGFDALPVYRAPRYAEDAQLRERYPLVMISGSREPWFTHSQHRNIERLRRLMPEPLVSVNPRDAEPLGISNGCLVAIEAPLGRVVMKARVTDEVPQGVVNTPHGWVGANINRLVDGDDLDPISGYPSYKAQVCAISRLTGGLPG